MTHCPIDTLLTVALSYGKCVVGVRFRGARSADNREPGGEATRMRSEWRSFVLDGVDVARRFDQRVIPVKECQMIRTCCLNGSTLPVLTVGQPCS